MSKVVLILGSGPNIGSQAAKAFALKGYKVALASRSVKEDSTTDQMSISSDLSNPQSVTEVFSKVKKALGIPSVVIYNAASATPSEKSNPLSVSVADFTRDLNINTISTFAAAQQALAGFEQLPDESSRTFIYTGNVLNTTIMEPLLTLGVGKSATAHIIQSAAAAFTYRGFKFYYADERKPDGSPAYFDIDGAAHAKHYVDLSEGASQGPWQQTFVKGVGYKQF